MRKKKPSNPDLETDDEILREEAVADGETKVDKWKLRPVTALTISWMQRNRIFEEDRGDMIWRAAAFGFLHSADRAEIRAVVNDSNAFSDAVDDWLEDNIEHHSQTLNLAKAMNDAFARYMSSVSTLHGGNRASGN